MNYDDFALPKKSQLEKLAKGYADTDNQAQNFELEQLNPAILDSVCYSLKFLNWLYSYVKRNLRKNKLWLFFNELATESQKDFSDLESKFYDSPKIIKLTKSKKINSLNSCIKLAIYTEIELVENVFKLFKCDNCEFVEPLLEKHFNIIKKLSSI